MKPVRLTMQAFGPYANREVIDFRDAVKAGLFGIYGSTGSGKSTIFSAMTFALFGEAAKSEQDPPSLRSDHAETGLRTEVEFVFDIDNRRFVVCRYPDQTRPKLKGEGETQRSHEAFLWDATGLALDEINEDQRGKIIEEKKVRAVDHAIENLLGYGAPQFRQIVLLPQGRFEKFLSAKTKERLEILRDLFDVSLYRNLSEKLKASAEQMERSVREEREICNRRLKSEGFESTDTLITEIEVTEEQVAVLKKREEKARTVLTGAQKGLHEAQNLEGKFQASRAAQEALHKLEENKVSMAERDTNLKKAEKARQLLDVETAVSNADENVAVAEQEFEIAQLKNKSAKANADSTDRQWKQQNEKTFEIDDLSKHLEDLKRYKKTLEQAKEKKVAVDDAQVAEQKAAKRLESAHTQVEELQNEMQKKIKLLSAARQTREQRISIDSDLIALNNAFTASKAYENAKSTVIHSEINLETLILSETRARDNEHIARDAFENAENKLAETHAVNLALKLSNGEPCPVCGATDHPSLATGSRQHAGLDKAFSDIKTALTMSESNLREAEQKIAVAKSELEIHRKGLSNLNQPNETTAAITAQIAFNKEALKELGSETDIPAAEDEVESIGTAIINLDAKREELRTDHSTKQQKTASDYARLEETIATVPTEQRDLEALLNQTDKTASSLAEMKRIKGEAESLATKAREDAIIANKDLETATSNLSNCKKSQEKAKKTFNSRLEEKGLTQEDFSEIKPAIKNIDEDRTAVEEYTRQLRNAAESAEAKGNEISELAPPDLKEIASKQEEAQDTLNSETNFRAEAQQRLSRFVALHDELADTLRELQKKEEDSGPLRNIAAATNGDNPHALTLETFAIGAMFEQVLKAANLRLGPMTTNRYQLERDIDGGGRGRRGLGIQVLDAHTGKTRPTTTLSGGETFIAALALAIGLADIVESISGKVRLETIFIDEGFGSLDTENGTGTLDQVLHILNTLVSQNRSVGLISHVPLVQEAVSNGFYVRKGLTGSTIEVREVL